MTNAEKLARWKANNPDRIAALDALFTKQLGRPHPSIIKQLREDALVIVFGVDVNAAPEVPEFIVKALDLEPIPTPTTEAPKP